MRCSPASGSKNKQLLPNGSKSCMILILLLILLLILILLVLVYMIVTAPACGGTTHTENKQKMKRTLRTYLDKQQRIRYNKIVSYANPDHILEVIPCCKYSTP